MAASPAIISPIVICLLGYALRHIVVVAASSVCRFLFGMVSVLCCFIVFVWFLVLSLFFPRSLTNSLSLFGSITFFVFFFWFGLSACLAICVCVCVSVASVFGRNTAAMYNELSHFYSYICAMANSKYIKQLCHVCLGVCRDSAFGRQSTSHMDACICTYL